MQFWFNLGWFTISFVSPLETKENENQPRLQIKPEIKFDLEHRWVQQEQIIFGPRKKAL